MAGLLHHPLVSVVMAAYNAADDLDRSISSILSQSMGDFEFIIVDDGSTDGTSYILDRCSKADQRVRVITQENSGLTVALNRGCALARGRYIARQDADDMSYPSRFEKQLAVLESHPEILVVGGNSNDCFPDGQRGTWGWYEPEILQRVVFFKTPFPHSTVMMRTEMFRELGGYDESFKTSQDMELWMRFAQKGMLGMVSSPVIERSISNSSISTKRRWRQFYDALRARWKHNPNNKIRAVYYSVRGLIIGLLPYGVSRIWRRLKTG